MAGLYPFQRVFLFPPLLDDLGGYPLIPTWGFWAIAWEKTDLKAPMGKLRQGIRSDRDPEPVVHGAPEKHQCTGKALFP